MLPSLYIRLNTSTRLIKVEQLLQVEPANPQSTEMVERTLSIKFNSLSSLFVSHQFQQYGGVIGDNVNYVLNLVIDGWPLQLNSTQNFSELFGQTGGIYIDATFYDPQNLTPDTFVELIMTTINQ